MKEYAFLIPQGKVTASTKDPKRFVRMVINLQASDINMRTERETKAGKEVLPTGLLALLHPVHCSELSHTSLKICLHSTHRSANALEQVDRMLSGGRGGQATWSENFSLGVAFWTNTVLPKSIQRRENLCKSTYRKELQLLGEIKLPVPVRLVLH